MKTGIYQVSRRGSFGSIPKYRTDSLLRGNDRYFIFFAYFLKIDTIHLKKASVLYEKSLKMQIYLDRVQKFIHTPSVLPKIIIVYGPTACGKTGLSIEVAKHIGSEIISADSRQIYRHMDIGTGKATHSEMQ